MTSSERVVEKHLDSFQHHQRPSAAELRVAAYEALMGWMVEYDKIDADIVAAVCSEVAEHWSGLAREENNYRARHAIVDVAHLLEEIGDDFGAQPDD